MVCSESSVRYKSRPDYEMGLLQNLNCKLDFKFLSGVVNVSFRSSGMYIFFLLQGKKGMALSPFSVLMTFESRHTEHARTGQDQNTETPVPGGVHISGGFPGGTYVPQGLI